MVRMRLFAFALALATLFAALPTSAILDAEKTSFTSFTIPNATSGKPVS